jgi:RHS repeat-associated protein
VMGRGDGQGAYERHDYFPYGEEMISSANNRDKFGTYSRDGHSGLDYADQRYYASRFGRFRTSDPYEASGGASEPGSWNRYPYVGGDPVNYSDPFGLAPCPPGSNCIEVIAKPPQVHVFIDPMAEAMMLTMRTMSGSGVLIPQLEWIPPSVYPISPCSQPSKAPDGASIASNLQRAFEKVHEVWTAEALANSVGETTLPLEQLSLWFADLVRTGGDWDYKQGGPEYQLFGNFNFAVVGRALGFSEEVLQRAAGLVQHVTDLLGVLNQDPRIGSGFFLGPFPHGDDPSDQRAIQWGSQIFERFMSSDCTFF